MRRGEGARFVRVQGGRSSQDLISDNSTNQREHLKQTFRSKRERSIRSDSTGRRTGNYVQTEYENLIKKKYGR